MDMPYFGLPLSSPVVIFKINYSRSTGFFENTTRAERQNKKGVQLFNLKGGKCGIIVAMFCSITVSNVKLGCKVPEYNALSTTLYSVLFL